MSTVDTTEFPLVNQQQGSPRFGFHYKSVTAGDDTFHVYSDGQVERLIEKGPDADDTPTAPTVPMTSTPPGVPDPVPGGTLPSASNPLARPFGGAVTPNPPANPTIPTQPATTGTSVTSTATSDTGVSQADIAAMRARIQELETQAQGTVSASRARLGNALSVHDSDIQLSQLEPGLIWGIRQGLIDPTKLGSHVSDLLKLEASDSNTQVGVTSNTQMSM